MQNYIRLLTYENALKLIDFVESLKNHDDYACITIGGVSLKSTEENHPKILDYLKSLNGKFELTESHPQVVNKKIVAMFKHDSIETSNEKDKALIITDRQIGHLREQISRVQRQIKLIKQGNTHSDETDRMDIAVDCCKDIDRVLCDL